MARGPSGPWMRRTLKWVGLAALGWILLSFLAFAVSAQLQAFKLSGDAKSTLHGNPFLLPSAPDDPRARHRRPPAGHQGARRGALAGVLRPAGPRRRPPRRVLVRRIPRRHADADPTPAAAPSANSRSRATATPRSPARARRRSTRAYAYGGAGAQIEAVEDFLDIEVDHVAIVNFTGFEDLIDAVGGVEVDVPVKICADISGGAGGGQGGSTLRLGEGENTLDGEQALTYARIRHASPCPGPGASAYALGYDDLDREKAQQAVISGIKGRLTDPLRLPYNFVKGPIIGWSAPKAFVSDMGFLTMPQLILAAGIGGDSEADVLCQGANSGCSPGPAGSIEVPDSERRRAVKKLLG